jgi:hypothetical protein
MGARTLGTPFAAMFGIRHPITCGGMTGSARLI